MTAILAAALDARSATLRPRSAVLAQSVATAIREGDAGARLQELLDAHDWMHIPGLDLASLNDAVAAAEASGEDCKGHMLRLMKTLDAEELAPTFFLLLHEDAIPMVLAGRGG